MRPAALTPGEFTSVFDWRPPRSRRRALASFIVASVVLHAFCFYVFQIIYPPTVALLPPPARVNIITPESEDGRVLLRWVEAEDPALSSTTQRPPNAVALQPPEPAHIPSYAGRQPALRELPRYEPNLTVPSARPPGPVPLARVAPAAQSVSVPTRVTFEGTAPSLGDAQVRPAQFTASRNDPPQTARFRVAIDARGAVRHCFLETSSEDPALDEQARNYILRSRFAVSDTQQPTAESVFRWTRATVEWGNDLTTPGKPVAEKRAP